MFAFSSPKTQVEDLIFLSLHILHQPDQKPLPQKIVINGRHFSEAGRKWWYRIKNSCAAVTLCNSISQLDAIPQFWLLDWEPRKVNYCQFLNEQPHLKCTGDSYLWRPINTSNHQPGYCKTAKNFIQITHNAHKKLFFLNVTERKWNSLVYLWGSFELGMICTHSLLLKTSSIQDLGDWKDISNVIVLLNLRA